MKKTPKFLHLTTPWSDAAKAETPWNVYPRPSMKRDNWINLNGKWDFEGELASGGSVTGKITVPFPPESLLSGLDITGKSVSRMICRRVVDLPETEKGKRVLLHIGAADQIFTVRVNSKECCKPLVGVLPNAIDITDSIIGGENLIEISVTDKLDKNIPYGKQRYDRGGMWYTPVSGLWQTVWIETVPEAYIGKLIITPDLRGADIRVIGENLESKKTVVLHTERGDVTAEFEGDEFRLDIDEPRLWSPEEPNLYEITVICGDDRVESYFGLRTVEAKDGKVLLNGKPYFFHGLLDQGYYSDGIYTPASPEGYEFDIATMKKLGFNTLRKHIKVEPEIFYHLCDKLGMIVFQDFINNGEYNFFIDTALPTVGLKKGITHRAGKIRRELFETTAEKTVELLRSHPSVCYYTIFNEGWGQYDADKMYRRMKELDPTRIWDATSGWFKEKESDVLSEHIYFKPVKCSSNGTRPLILSEFGGYSCKVDGHSFNPDKTYGYRFYTDPQEFRRDLVKLYEDEVIPAMDRGLWGAILTQVSDVEDETNGLVTYDRRVVKVNEEEMQAVAKKIYGKVDCPEEK